MAKSNSLFGDSFKKNKSNNKDLMQKNKAITATFARREYLLRELKETNAMLHHLMSQLDVDEEYKKLTKV